ncbi:hypothetical protein HDU81_006428 [Chytriomyces hyalinus]|nr:hypothetical protein HDU81_006428 [Chytriomyces hyalinus]
MAKKGGRLKNTLLKSTAYTKNKNAKGQIIAQVKKGPSMIAKKDAVTAAPQPLPKKRGNVKPPYSHHQTMLLVGEGNFSFANSLISNIYVEAPENMTATSFDTLEVVKEKYPDAEVILNNLEESGVTLFHGVDASNISKCKPLKGKKFDIIVFNFPHVGAGIKDQDRNIMANQELIAGFFKSALQHLNPNGEIHIALKNSHPYTNWNIKLLASNQDLCMKSKTPFIPSMYPGYAHRRTIGFDDRISTTENEDLMRGAGADAAAGISNCFTFAFWRLELARKQSQKKQQVDGNESE